MAGHYIVSEVQRWVRESISVKKSPNIDFLGIESWVPTRSIDRIVVFGSSTLAHRERHLLSRVGCVAACVSGANCFVRVQPTRRRNTSLTTIPRSFPFGIWRGSSPSRFCACSVLCGSSIFADSFGMNPFFTLHIMRKSKSTSISKGSIRVSW